MSLHQTAFSITSSSSNRSVYNSLRACSGSRVFSPVPLLLEPRECEASIDMQISRRGRRRTDEHRMAISKLDQQRKSSEGAMCA